ncbi:MAG: hypothetical protein MJZ30_03715 [Paludibacteraceae bacterium]|nr:hypothetical protein [Paludibacteraceae bacterium]
MEEYENREEKSGSGQQSEKYAPWTQYYHMKKREYGDRVENRLNAMPVAKRRKWFAIVFGSLLALLLFNFMRWVGRDATERPSAVEMVADSVIDWSQVDVADLSVLNFDSLAKEMGQCDSLDVEPYKMLGK